MFSKLLTGARENEECSQRKNAVSDIDTALLNAKLLFDFYLVLSDPYKSRSEHPHIYKGDLRCVL